MSFQLRDPKDFQICQVFEANGDGLLVDFVSKDLSTSKHISCSSLALQNPQYPHASHNVPSVCDFKGYFMTACLFVYRNVKSLRTLQYRMPAPHRSQACLHALELLLYRELGPHPHSQTVLNCFIFMTQILTKYVLFAAGKEF